MPAGIGIFGTGEVTRVLVPLLREKGFEIKALWGQKMQDAEVLAKELKIDFWTNKIDQILLKKDIDLIFVMCPPYLHSQISVKALGIGKHVVCDKPMGIGQSDSLKMVKASQYYPALISIVNHSLRFLPAFVAMKRAIQEGYIGPVSLIDIRVRMGKLLHDKYDWLCDATNGGGALTLIGSHVVDLCSYLTERRATRVHGVVRSYTTNTKTMTGIRSITAPDFCTFQMELQGGILATATLHSHVSSNLFMQEVLVCGAEGHLTVRGGDLIGHKVRADGGDMKEEVLYLDVQDLQQMPGPETLLPRPYVKGLCKMVGALREAFQAQSGWAKEPVQAAATFEDGLYVQAVLDAIRRSNDERCWTRVSILNESPNNQDKLIAAAKMSAVALH